MRHLWLTDCQSLVDKLHNPTPSAGEDKRLEIDILSLHEPLWFDREGQQKDHMQDDPEDDRIRWIDTSTMLADPLTKMTKPKRLNDALKTGILELERTPESKIAKMMRQKQRSKKTEETEEDDKEEPRSP